MCERLSIYHDRYIFPIDPSQKLQALLIGLSLYQTPAHYRLSILQAGVRPSCKQSGTGVCSAQQLLVR